MDWLNANLKPSQAKTAGRILEWFVGQPAYVQQLVLSQPELRNRSFDIAILRAMADELESNNHPEKPAAPLDDVTINLPMTAAVRKRKGAG